MNKENEIEIRFEVKDKKIFQEFSELNKVLEFEKASEKKTLIENQIFDDKEFSHAKKGIFFRKRRKDEKIFATFKKRISIKEGLEENKEIEEEISEKQLKEFEEGSFENKAVKKFKENFFNAEKILLIKTKRTEISFKNRKGKGFEIALDDSKYELLGKAFADAMIEVESRGLNEKEFGKVLDFFKEKFHLPAINENKVERAYRFYMESKKN